MSSSKLDFRWLTVLKDYPEKEHERWEREVWAYQNLSWATPKLDGFNPRWIEMERLVPILDLPYDVARKYRDPRSEEHTSELQSRGHLVSRLLLEKKKKYIMNTLVS